MSSLTLNFGTSNRNGAQSLHQAIKHRQIVMKAAQCVVTSSVCLYLPGFTFALALDRLVLSAVYNYVVFVLFPSPL